MDGEDVIPLCSSDVHFDILLIDLEVDIQFDNHLPRYGDISIHTSVWGSA